MTGDRNTYDDLMPEAQLATIRLLVGLTLGSTLALAGLVGYGVETHALVADSLPIITSVPQFFALSVLLFGLGAGLSVMMINHIAGVATTPTLWKVSSVYVPIVLVYADMTRVLPTGFDPELAFVHLCFMCLAGILWAMWRTRSLNPLSRSF
jgi:hypothetical protein